MSSGVRLAAVIMVLTSAWGADPAPLPGASQPPRPAPQALEAQRRSVSAMEASVARQRAAMALMRAAVIRHREAAWPVSGPLALVQPDPPAPAGRDCAALPEARVAALVSEAGAREGLAAGLLRAVIEKESSSYPCAVSSQGALGLMQLMPATVTALSVRDPFDPKENVDAGAKLLKQLLLRYGGDLALALSAYNAGPARVDETGDVPKIPETMDYVRHILTQLASP